MAIGDLVIVVDDDAPRDKWTTCRVVHVHPGKNGVVRAASVKVGEKIYVRPVAKLCLLEEDADPAPTTSIVRWKEPPVRKKNDQSRYQVSIDDEVVIMDGNAPRHKWQTGRVVKNHPGKDGINRAALVDVGGRIKTCRLSNLF